MVVYLFCLLFCAHYLHHLSSKRYSTTYEMKETNFSRPNLSICFPLYIRFKFNCSSASNELLRSGCDRFFRLYNYYNDETDTTRTPVTILQYAAQLNLNDSFAISENYQFESFYLNFNYLCLKFSFKERPPHNDSEMDVEERTFSLTVQNNYFLPCIVFFHEKNFLYFFYHYFFRQRNCKIFESCMSFEFQIEQYQLNHQKAPYGEQCLDYKQLEFEGFRNQIDNEEVGLVECVKQKLDRPISLFFFTLNDTKRFLFLPTNYASSPVLSELPKSEIYRNCSRAFRRKDCTKHIHIITEQKNSRDNLSFYFKKNAKLIQETVFLTEFDFWLQVLGFVSLIFGISLNSSLDYMSTSVIVHFSPKLTVANAIFCFRYFLVFIGLYIVLRKTMCMINEYQNQTSYTVIYYNFMFDQKTVKIYICFPLASTIKGYEQIDDEQLANRTKDLLARYPLKKLQENRVRPTSLIESICLTDGRLKSNLSVEGFENETFLLAKYASLSARIYSKCFNYHIELSLPTYQRMLKSSALKIKFKVNQTAFFFTEIDQQLTRSDDQLWPTDYISRFRFIADKDQCQDYGKMKNLSCTSQEACLDECAIDRYNKSFLHLSVLSVIHQANFRKFADLKFSHDSKETHFDYERYVHGGEDHREGFLKLENECRQLYAKKDCDTVKYRSRNKKVTVQREHREVLLDMFFFNQIYRQNDQMKIIPFISNLLTLWCIMIDVSFSSLFHLFLNLVRARLRKDLSIALLNRKLTSFQTRQRLLNALRLIKRLSVFSLFLGSLILIIFETFENELIQSIYFDTTTDQFDFPVIGFCFGSTKDGRCKQLESRLEKGNMTGEELDKLTSRLNIDKVLDRVEYIDSSHRNVTWRPGGRFDANLRIEHFFYLKKKCFAFNYDLNTTDNKHLLIDYALHIYFKQDLPFSLIYYFTKVKYEESFSQFHNLNASNFMYTIRLECMKVHYNDMLAKFKRPLILFNSKYQLSDSTYIESMRKWFEEATGFSTLYLPLRNESFGLTIRDDEFRRFYAEKILPNERIFHNPNFRRTFCKDFIVATEDDKQLNFYIVKQMIKSLNLILNRTNYVLFFNNIVNLLTFWYGLSVIETLILAVKATSAQVYRREINLMKKLRRLLPSRPIWRQNRNSVHNLNE